MMGNDQNGDLPKCHLMRILWEMDRLPVLDRDIHQLESLMRCMNSMSPTWLDQTKLVEKFQYENLIEISNSSLTKINGN
jgi:hypothetical protein